MDLRDLRYFETIAELEHLGRAADRLHRTQPALTSCIRRLEDECGAPLFERAGRGIRLTTTGHVLLKWAKRMRLDVQDAQREIGDINSGLLGHIRLGIAPTTAQFLLPPVTRQLMAQAPDVSLSIVVGLVDMLRSQLHAGEIDLIVGTESVAEPGLVSLPLMEDTIVVAASAEHEILLGSPSLRDLTAYRWVLQPPGAPTRDWLDHTFDRAGLSRPYVQVESNMLLTVTALIAETGLLSFISRRRLTRKEGAGLLKEVAIRETTMHRRLVITYRDKSYLSPATSLLITLLKNAGFDAEQEQAIAL